MFDWLRRLLLEEGGWSRIWYGLATAMVVAGGGLIYHQIPGGGSPPAGTANLWMDTNGGTCARSSSPVEYNDATACSTIGAAYTEADQGDLVLIKAGTYSGSGVVSRDGTKTTASDVVFRPDQGAAVEFTAQWAWRGSHATVDGSTGAGGYLTADSFELESVSGAGSPTVDVTFEHIHALGGQSQIQTTQDITIRDMDIGGQNLPSCSGNGTDALRLVSDYNDSGSADDPTNILIEDSRIGEICRPDDQSHPDCLAISGGINVTIRRNRIWNCGTQGLYMIEELGGNIDNVLIENNMFGDCDTPGDDPSGDCSNSLIVDRGSNTNIVIRYNSFAVNVSGGGFRSTGAEAGTDILVYGNAGEGPSCDDPFVTFSYNVWDDADCSATDVQANPGFVSNASGPTFDLHLASTSSPACGAGDPDNYPAADYDGDTRSSPPEAGADQKAGC